jgi:hypothetical protein
MKHLILVLTSYLFTTLCYSQSKGKLIPDELTLQHAGSIGYFSVGAGYNIFKSNGNFRIFYGYIPEEKGGEYNIISAKLNFITSRLKISDKIELQPSNVGMFVAYHASGDLSSTWPSNRYPEGYYWWRPSTRFHLSVEQRVYHQFIDKKIKGISYFTEFNVNELYIVSLWQNVRSLDLHEVIKLGFGLTIHLR